MTIRPIILREANAYVAQHHRHNQPTNGHKWSLACYDGDRLCGVAICGQPVARALDDGLTIEIRRVCTDGTRNACSTLYGACCRVAKAMGYKRVVTYTLVSEPGASLRASNFTDCGEAGGGIVEYAQQTAGAGAGDTFRHGAEVFDRTEAQMGKEI